MQKEDVLVVHLALFHVKRILEGAGLADGHFRAYESLGIRPIHVNKSKIEHKKAVLLLCRGISEILTKKPSEKIFENTKIQEMIATAR